MRVEVDPLRQFGNPVVVDATPALGTGTRIEIVLVPLVSGGFAPTMPTPAQVLDEITRRFPIPRANIGVTARAAYTLTSVTDGLDTQTDWSNALVELNQLRSMEVGNNPTRFYFGFVRRSGGGIAGIGYVPGRAALGWDAASQWVRTMSHEIGHNLSRPHAPCGNVASPDPNYPYPGGVLGATPLMDSVPAAINIISPVAQTDIMGYCGGTWFPITTTARCNATWKPSRGSSPRKSPRMQSRAICCWFQEPSALMAWCSRRFKPCEERRRAAVASTRCE